ncbi:MAG: hypothetical protein R3E89_11725 [Thiolinea sp.]
MVWRNAIPQWLEEDVRSLLTPAQGDALQGALWLAQQCSMKQSTLLTRFRYFEGDTLREDCALLLTDGLIERILPTSYAPPAGVDIIDCQGHLLAPGFIDIQVNGGGGVMFNDEPNLAGIDAIRRAHWSGGTTGLLPTLITDSAATMRQAVEAVATALQQGMPGILGIHLEGPHLNPARRGVHSTRHIRPLDADTLALLDLLPADKLLLTLAPELLPAESLRQLSARGIRVSAGHTAANYAQPAPHWTKA